MSLLRKPKLNARWKKVLLTLVSLLLVIPCLAAASFAMRFEVNSADQNQAQEPSQQEKEAKEKEAKEKAVYVLERRRQEEEELKKRIAADPQLRAEFEERAKKQEFELRMRALNQATLAKLARISMDQAIQIATSQQPGKVLESSLVGERWEEPGKLAKDGKVLYHVVILTGEEPDFVLVHTLVNAIDGTILKMEKELPRRRSPEPQ